MVQILEVVMMGAMERMRDAARDLVVPEVMEILDNHQYLRDRCACGVALGTTLADPDEDATADPGWVSWIIHIEQETTRG